MVYFRTSGSCFYMKRTTYTVTLMVLILLLLLIMRAFPLENTPTAHQASQAYREAPFITPALGEGTTTIKTTGIVIYLPFQGGRYAIQASNGVIYFPLNLPPKFKRHNFPVAFRGKTMPQIKSSIRWAIPIKIIKIVRFKPGISEESNTLR